jgi:hypothetical protein
MTPLFVSFARTLHCGFPVLALLFLNSVPVALHAADEPMLRDPAASDSDLPLRPLFAGSWQKDFARSDKWEEEVQRIIDQLNREMQRQQGRGDAGAVGMSGSRRGAGNLVAHARLAELITRQTTMRISQSGNEVRIERQGDAALVCSTLTDIENTFSSAHGSELCGWDRLQLVFQIMLAEGVLIEHRFSVDPSGEELSMLTSVSSRGSTPFNLMTFYTRYEAPEEGINCVQTLSRGLVCSALDGSLESSTPAAPAPEPAP